MSSATVTSKGQVTIPVDVRTKLGVRPGSRLAFVPTDSGGYEIHLEAASVRDLKGAVPRPSQPVTLQDMNEAVVLGATTPTT
ncbi:MAG: AbrB/MazE/SpoVT family DNA-binding domain-containing protein [Acidimicrobiales bacterium]